MENTKNRFVDVLTTVLENRKYTFRSLGTYAWEQRISRKIIPFFENKYIEDIDTDVIRKFYNAIRFKSNGEMLSLNYLKAIKTLLKATFDSCIEKGIILKDPLFNFKLPSTPEKNHTDRIINEVDLKKLVSAAAKHKRLKYLIGVLLLTGMRIGELLALKWSDVDMEQNIIYVKHSINIKYIEENGTVRSCGPQISATKTSSSVREIPVNNMVLSLLNEWEKALLEFCPNIDSLKKTNKTCDVIFVNYHGKLMSYNTIYDELMDFLKSNNLAHCGVLFHKLRHCYATHMVDAGVDINVVSKLLGHAYIGTTSKFYVRVNKAPKIAAMKLHEKHIVSVLGL